MGLVRFPLAFFFCTGLSSRLTADEIQEYRPGARMAHDRAAGSALSFIASHNDRHRDGLA